MGGRGKIVDMSPRMAFHNNGSPTKNNVGIPLSRRCTWKPRTHFNAQDSAQDRLLFFKRRPKPQTELFCACGYQELLAYIYIFVHNLTNYDLNSLANKIANIWQFYCANIGFFIENIIGQICLTHFDSTLFIPYGQPPLSQTSSGTRG
jgi:hypothetical protein